MSEITEKPIRDFTPLAKVPHGEFPALMGGNQSVAEVVDSSTGRPVLVGAVQSSLVAGSEVWVPNQSVGEARLVIGKTSPTNIPLRWLAAGEDPVTGSSYVSLSGDPTGTEVSIGMAASDPGGTDRTAQVTVEAGGTDASIKGTMLLLHPAGSRSITFQLVTGGYAEITDFQRARDFAQSGYVDITLSGTVSGTSAVTFPKSFTAAPNIVASTNNRVYIGAAESVTATGFTAAVRHADNAAASTTVRLHWVAMNPNS